MKKTLFAAGAVLVFLAACGVKQERKEKIPSVKVISVIREDISSSIRIAGSVDSKQNSVAISPVEGSVYSLSAYEGKNVLYGEILASVMPQDQQNLLGQAKSDWETLKREYDKAPSSDKEKLLAKLKESELNLESAKNLYKPVPVVSSITGTVIMKNVEIGNNVSLKQPLFEIADLNRLIVKSAVFERYVSKISLGQKVPVILHSFTDKPLIGTLSVITPGISTESRTSAIEVAIEAKDYIKPGMTASLEINLEKKQNAVTVPLDAVVINASGEKTIFTVQNDTAKLIKITTGVESDYKTEVLSGLKERDLIVVLGQDNLADGIRVKIAGQEKAEKPKGKNKK